MEDEGPVKEPAAPQINDVAPPPQATAPTGPAPVHAADDDAEVASPQPQRPTPSVGNEVMAAPAREDDESEEDAHEQPVEHHEAAPAPKPQKPATDKPHGTTLAIIAAIIIVLGLGAMLTYAYLRS